MSCNPTLQLGFSFCQSSSSCSGLLMSWHPGEISGRAEHSTGALHRPYTYVHKHTTYIYIYISTTFACLSREWATIADGLA